MTIYALSVYYPGSFDARLDETISYIAQAHGAKQTGSGCGWLRGELERDFSFELRADLVCEFVAKLCEADPRISGCVEGIREPECARAERLAQGKTWADDASVRYDFDKEILPILRVSGQAGTDDLSHVAYIYQLERERVKFERLFEGVTADEYGGFNILQARPRKEVTEWIHEHGIRSKLLDMGLVAYDSFEHPLRIAAFSFDSAEDAELFRQKWI